MADLKIGAKGSRVKTLQSQLNDLGAKPKLVLDGFFDTKTEAAVKALQKR